MGNQADKSRFAENSRLVIDGASGVIGVGSLCGNRVRMEQITRVGDGSLRASGLPTVGLVGDDHVDFRSLKIPSLPPKQMGAAVVSESVRQFDFDEGQQVIDFWTIDPNPGSPDRTGASSVDVNVAMLPTDKIDSVRSAAVGCEGNLVQLGPRSHADWQAWSRSGKRASGLTMLIVRRDRRFEIGVGDENNLWACGSVIAKDCGGAALRFLAAFTNRFPDAQVTRAVLVSDQDEAEDLASKLSLPVERFEPLEGVEIDAAIQESLESQGLSPVDCLGIVGALASPIDGWQVNFLRPQQFASIPVHPQRGKLVVAATVVAATLLVLGTMRVVLWRGAAEIELLAARQAELAVKLQDADQTLAQFRAVADVCRNRSNSLLELKRISDAVADKRHVYAASLSFEFDHAISGNERIVLSGFATDHQSISSLQRQLDGQPMGPVSSAGVRGGRYRYGFQSSIPTEKEGS